MKFINTMMMLIASISLFSCVGSEGVKQSSGRTASVSGDWSLMSLNSSSYQGNRITLQFNADNKVSGFSGCNRYVASSTRQSNGNLRFGFIGSTKKLCVNRQANQLESSYLKALRQVQAYQLSGNRLILQGNGTNLVFTK